MESPHRVPVSVFAAALFSVIGVFALTGVATALLPQGATHWIFHLDRELNLATFFSAWLLFASGWLILRHKLGGEVLPLPIRFLAALFLFMGADECLKIHETMEKLTGVDWQILYLPIILAAGIGWIQVIRLFCGAGRFLWFAGAVAWASSQLFEAAQWGWWVAETKVNGYIFLMTAEEILEMLGSAFFLVAVYHETVRVEMEEAKSASNHSFRTSLISHGRERLRSGNSPREILSSSGQSNR
ncbi:MAG: hypothetical protein AAF491_07940 [Verrucomicrobiota bacterium]